ncbi:bifunctional diguanylate cyclase/phosphodiesterase [Kutzneria buriramensis]|uniref:PAS domain S-box-containing protein/diguanylate cyclase (GGDEF)-like protein n=1 Tax=Kutzneria buriramensis TaxID=1045776 RepID=A0A3E0HDD6_9PSEU|nr:bifunctional diguanylate cyclase/phosphodiesterase [Kutzneria buriramensis]REH42828.1 PAS domain S-box-containing protein/diguanylate cyclase (GGDEF)-like protein [Kutzneria buriramensis]
MADDGRSAELREFAEGWAAAIIDTSYVPMSRREIEDFLLDLSGSLLTALLSEPFDPAPALEVGARLVNAHFTAPEALGRTLQLLGTGLVQPAGLSSEDQRLLDRVVQLLGRLSTGYSEALRERTFEEQEVIKQAMWLATDVAQRRLQDSESRFLAVFDSAPIGLAIGDFDSNILESNQALQDLLGYTREELNALTGADILHPDDIPDTLERYNRLFRGEYPSFRSRQRLLKKDGDVLWANVTVSAVRDSTGVATYQVAMVEDATELHYANQAMATLGMQDPLTGLPTRTAFMARLDSVLGRVDRPRRVALCVFGIDGFATINDGLGPEVGDEVLLKLGTKLRYHAEDNKMLAARLGGDEFALLIEESEGTRTVTPLVEEALRLINEPVTVLGHRLSVHASVGIVERAVGREQPAELLRDATMALHWAKQGGKAQWALFDQQRCDRDRAQLQLALTMPVALDNGEFTVVYQPIRSLGDNRLVAVEAQLTWDHPEHGLLAAAEFLALAERTGLVVRLSEWMLLQACGQARQWQQEFGERAPIVSVKTPPRQARDPDFLPNVIRALADSGLDGGLLRLELAQDAIDCDSEEQVEDMELLAERGITFSIAGLSGHRPECLVARPLTVLKSRDLAVSQVDGERETIPATVTWNTVSLAHQMGMQVIAENVDTLDDVAWLREIGVDAGQGVALGEPVDAEEIGSLLTP